ncbi:MAG: adenylate/guanylate cyclase domain-containing protein [Balneolales bacterium]
MKDLALQFSIRWKLLAAFVGMILVLVLVMLYSIGSIVEDRIREEIGLNFTEAGLVFERIQEIRFRQLRQSGILLSEIPQLKAAISTGDSTTVTQLLRNDIRYLLDFDPIIPDSLISGSFDADPDSGGLLLVSDHNGLPIGQMSTSALPRYSIADRPGVSEALQGIYPERAYIWKTENSYFNVITVPVFLQNRLYGTLSYGFPMRQLETEQLSRDIGMDISYFVDNKLIASSFTYMNSLQHEELTKLIHNTTYDVVSANDAKSLAMQIDNEDWLMYVAPMQPRAENSRDIPGYFIVAKSLTLELQTLRNIRTLIFFLGIIGILGATAISFWITGRITKPISMLVEGVHRMEREDFSREVPVTTHDELGTLTSAFNKLGQGIQERLLMLKFVSKATLDAIKNNLSQIDPGGEMREVVVFFSDIRDFTSWSEKRNPQEVIDMLNELFSFQAEAIQKYGGDIDKFVGDELVAVFQGNNKEQQAVEAAVYIQKNVKKIVRYPEEITVGIGINSGDVLMGAMGSSERMDYTVLGHNVNLGARLCSSANSGQILISDQVLLHLERRITTSTLNANTIRMKGFEQPIQVHEVVWAEITEYAD